MSTRVEELTIGEMAARSGFSEPTLRCYERIGLLADVPRDVDSGHRRYDARGDAESAAPQRDLFVRHAEGVEAARTELGWRPRDVVATVLDTVQALER